MSRWIFLALPFILTGMKAFSFALRPLCYTGLALWFALSACPIPAAAAPSCCTAAAPPPVSPILPEEFQGWPMAYRLQHKQAEAVLVPALGRLVLFAAREGSSPFRLDPSLRGRIPSENEAFFNIGGDWLWPVAQARWSSLTDNGRDWPPPPVLADRPWTCSAWTDADGTPCALLTREYGAPLHILVSRLFRLEPGKTALTIQQRIERTAPSDVPVVLWNISQVAQAGQVALPVDSHSRFHGGLKSLMGKKPTDSQLISCGDVSVYQVAEGAETKLGTDSPRSWIAAARDTHVIFESVQNTAQGSFPDGGCIIELYSNHGLGYSEIETLSPEVNLPPGKVLENTLRIVLASTESPLPACLWADFIRTLAGETIPAPAASAK